jgi:hypothetical protein
LPRDEALERLAARGISGTDVYLLDLLPLIEMMWADGLLQEPERSLLDAFVVEHVEAINRLAGDRILTMEQAREFASRFLDERPDDRLMADLRALIAPVRFSASDSADNDARRRSIIEWCLDIGAACVARYPYGDRERFRTAEKERFLSIVAALTSDRPSPSA